MEENSLRMTCQCQGMAGSGQGRTREVHCRSSQAAGVELAHYFSLGFELPGYSSPSPFASGFEPPLSFGAACVIGRQDSRRPLRVKGRGGRGLEWVPFNE